MTAYIIVGMYYTTKKVYLNKETAEKVRKEEEYSRYMSGSNDYHLYVKELEVEEN